MGAMSTAAHAQTNVTVYGTVDAGVRYSNNDNAAGEKRFSIGDGMETGSHFGIKGTEDLGQGTKALFVLEGGVNMGTGASTGNRTFGRQAFVGMSNEQLGTLTIGRQNSIGYDFIGSTVAWGITPVSEIGGYQYEVTGKRWDKSLKYTNKVGNGNFGAMYANGGVAGRTSEASSWAVSAGYKYSDLNLQSFYQVSNDTRDGIIGAALGEKEKVLGIGAAYGVTPNTKVFAQYVRNEYDISPVKNNIYTISANYNVAPAVVLRGGVTYDKQSNVDGRRMTYIAQADYNFSKRTNAYVGIDYNKLKDGYSNSAYNFNTAANLNDSRTGVMMGLRHRF